MNMPELKKISRRKFLTLTSVTVSASFIPVMNAQVLAQTTGADFQKLSAFLTGKEIKQELAQKAWDALLKVDNTFSEHYEKLRNFITSYNVKTVDDLQQHPDFKGELRQTAMTLISAYSLGYAGTARPVHAEDNTVFITYNDALMYSLTYHYTPIPSYSRWGTGYWSYVPA